MGEKTGIAWCDSSWSPWIGCTKVSPGCDGCYAEALDNRHQYGGAKHWGPGVPRYKTKQWGAPLAWNRQAEKSGKRWTVFPSLCDPFDNEVPEAWRAEFFRLIQSTPHLTWLLLTKRIGNAAAMLSDAFLDGCPDNVWIGASVVDQTEADRDIPKLLRVPCEVHFVSYEPALGPVNFMPWLAPEVGSVRWLPGKGPTPAGIREVYTVARAAMKQWEPSAAFIDWLIVGGESTQGGHKARPFRAEWARSAIKQCQATAVPVLMKQFGSFVLDRNDAGFDGCEPDSWPLRPDGCDPELEHDIHGPEQHQGADCRIRLMDRAGADPAEWPETLRIQEFPL